MNISELGKRCCGCGACAALCPAHCIDMRADAEGFLSPVIDAARCVNCGLCLSRCPVWNAVPGSDKTPLATYAAHARKEEDLLASSSGAMFTVLARDALSRGGLVFGAILDDQHAARIVAADDWAGVAAMRGSKYVQSELSGETLASLRAALGADRPVLFTGCPCQVAAVRAYLGRDDEHLLTADIICHGVPSPLLFETCMKRLEARAGGSVTAYRFRDKSKGSGMRYASAYVVNGKTTVVRSTFDPYMNHFLRAETFRESCYQCPFACPARAGDLTLGDYWGILQAHPDFYDARGVSAVLVNTEKGRAAFERVRDQIDCIPSEFEKAAARNENLRAPTKRPAMRDAIYAGLTTLDPKTYVDQKLKPTNSPTDILKALIPADLKAVLKKILGGHG